MNNSQLAWRVQSKGIEGLLATSGPFRKFVFALLREAGIFTPTYQQGSSHGTAYWEGRRSLGLEVLHMLKSVEPHILGLLEAEGNLLAVASADPPPDEDEPDETDP